MTKEEILEGNKLIAEFLGFETKHHWWHHSDPKFELGIVKSSINSAACKFHSSWDWLMPVAVKIKEVVVKQDKIFSEANARFADVKTTLMRLDITEVWESVVEFIKWYNEQLN